MDNIGRFVRDLGGMADDRRLEELDEIEELLKALDLPDVEGEG